MRVAVVIAAVDVHVFGCELEEAERALQAPARQGDVHVEQQFVGVVDEEEKSVSAAQAEAEVELPVDVQADLAFGLKAKTRDADVKANIGAGVDQVLADLQLPPDFSVGEIGSGGEVAEGLDVVQRSRDEIAVAVLNRIS